MIGVALDLRRPAGVALDQDAGGEAAEDHGGRVVLGHVRSELGRLVHVRQDLLPRTPDAAVQAGEGETGAEQCDEAPPSHLVWRHDATRVVHWLYR